MRFETKVLLFCLGTHKIRAFQPDSATSNVAITRNRAILARLSQHYVAPSIREQDFEANNDNNSPDLQTAMADITNSYLESMSMETDAEDTAIKQRLDTRRRAQQQNSSGVGTFRVQFDHSCPIGISLSQVDSGRKISDVELDLDALRLEHVHVGELEGSARQCVDWPTVAGRLDTDFNGLLVSSVVQGSRAWDVGVRAGDVLISVSATLGDSMWPTSSLDGIQSAVRSRKLTSKRIFMEFCRVGADANQTGNCFQLTLQRPLGIEVQENEDGNVVVTGFTQNAPNLVRHAIQIGDRVVAVDSSLGGSMWPVTTVEGLFSACTSRLPGAPVTLKFERLLENMQSAVEFVGSTVVAPSIASTAAKKAPVTVTDDVVMKQQPADKQTLIKRCRSVLERFSAKGENGGVEGFKNKYALPAIVADKVVDALASADVRLDSVTLSMIMRAYLSCNLPDSALRVFEAAVGLRADATCLATPDGLVGSDGGTFIPNESALNLYTGTALLQAHAMKNDLYSVSRVLASLEGRSGVLVNGLESAPWPFTGVYGSIQPDSTCYNVAISAASRIGGEEGLEMALALFETMANSEKESLLSRKPAKNVVTYNTVINALSSAGRSVDAFRVFDRMKKFKVRPDKYTYTPLIKTCLSDGDIEELLYDMRENHVKGDTVTYNALIRSLCEKRRWTDASELVIEMESKGISPDSRTYGTLMSAMLKAGKANACLTLFETAYISSKTTALTENVYLYTTAIAAASVLGDYERALELLSRMAAKGVKPNVQTLTSVMGACLASGEFGLAAQLFSKIEQPDGYAMCQGVEALSGSKQLSKAFDLLKIQRNSKTKVMTGQQVMKCYQTILVAALKFREYNVAEEVFTDLLRKGFIPNKSMLQSMSDALGFNEVRGIVSFAFEDESDKIPTFRFMMFVLDSLRERNLPVESNLYSIVLFLGRILGGKARMIASLIARAKVSKGERKLLATTKTEGQSAPGAYEIPSWVSLLDNFDQYDTRQLQDEKNFLPAVAVRVAGHDVRKLVRAEQEVSISTTQRVKSRKNEVKRSVIPGRQ